MKNWTRPLHSRERVNAAGDTLINPSAPEPEKNYALSVIGNWRSSHSYPLHALKMTLRRRALVEDRNALVAQRLKRLTSIAAKLERSHGMELARMHDIGGCRAVLSSIRKVTKLIKLYTASRGKNPKTRAEFVKAYDYITQPKADGYRSVHLVYKYRSDTDTHKCWNGLRIEIQIRSRLQHAWATAVETVDIFCGTSLKTSVGTGSEKTEWGRFFALISSYIALKEKCPLVHDAPSDERQLITQIREIATKLNVESRLRGWMTATHHFEDDAIAQTKAIKTAAVFLLTTDANKRIVSYRPYTQRHMQEAQDEFMQRETGAPAGVQSVLVSVDSMDKLREAYPSYFADTTVFLEVLEEVMSKK
jgi:hypothetical protein